MRSVYIFFILGLIILAAIQISGGLPVFSSQPMLSETTTVTPAAGVPINTTSSPQSSLQLNAFAIGTVTPTPLPTATMTPTPTVTPTITPTSPPVPTAIVPTRPPAPICGVTEPEWAYQCPNSNPTTICGACGSPPPGCVTVMACHG